MSTPTTETPARTVTIKHRETGEVATVMDVTKFSEREMDRFWTGLAYKVDFENWMAVDSATEGSL